MTTATGEKSAPYGEHPIGYLSYSEDGRMSAMGTSDGRMVPPDLALADEALAALYRTMFAYAGAYSLETGKVTHHVDISWNEVWNGTDQVRFYEVNGNTLSLASRATNPTNGVEAEFVVVWEKVTSPH
jgi:hypothetical protein